MRKLLLAGGMLLNISLAFAQGPQNSRDLVLFSGGTNPNPGIAQLQHNLPKGFLFDEWGLLRVQVPDVMAALTDSTNHMPLWRPFWWVVRGFPPSLLALSDAFRFAIMLSENHEQANSHFAGVINGESANEFGKVVYAFHMAVELFLQKCSSQDLRHFMAISNYQNNPYFRHLIEKRVSKLLSQKFDFWQAFEWYIFLQEHQRASFITANPILNEKIRLRARLNQDLPRYDLTTLPYHLLLRRLEAALRSGWESLLPEQKRAAEKAYSALDIKSRSKL